MKLSLDNIQENALEISSIIYNLVLMVKGNSEHQSDLSDTFISQIKTLHLKFKELERSSQLICVDTESLNAILVETTALKSALVKLIKMLDLIISENNSLLLEDLDTEYACIQQYVEAILNCVKSHRKSTNILESENITDATIPENSPLDLIDAYLHTLNKLDQDISYLQNPKVVLGTLWDIFIKLQDIMNSKHKSINMVPLYNITHKLCDHEGQDTNGDILNALVKEASDEAKGLQDSFLKHMRAIKANQETLDHTMELIDNLVVSLNTPLRTAKFSSGSPTNIINESLEIMMRSGKEDHHKDPQITKETHFNDKSWSTSNIPQISDLVNERNEKTEPVVIFTDTTQEEEKPRTHRKSESSYDRKKIERTNSMKKNRKLNREMSHSDKSSTKSESPLTKQDSMTFVFKKKKASKSLDDENLWLTTEQHILVSNLDNIQNRWQSMKDSKQEYIIIPKEEEELIKKKSFRGFMKTVGSLKLSGKIKKNKKSKDIAESKSPETPTTPTKHREEKSWERTVASKEVVESTSIYRARRSTIGASFVVEDVDDPRASLFELPDTEDVIILSPDGESIIAATIEKLIQRLTHDVILNPSYVSNFLLTYRAFASPAELLTLIKLRWNSKPLDGDMETFKADRLIPIRLRIYNVLKMWVERFFEDFSSSDEMMKELNLFVEIMKDNGMSGAANQLKKLITMKIEGTSKDLVETTSEPPPPIVPLASRCVRDFHPVEVARQITIMDHRYFRAIDAPSELLDTNWTKKDKETKSPNTLAMIRSSNHLVGWVTYEILKQEDLRERAMILNRFIYIAKALKDLNNFNGIMSILSALNNASIFRLQNTWNLLPKESWQVFEDLESIFNTGNNFKTYRNALERAIPPCIPYLGRHLSDLLFIEEKHTNNYGNNLIDFAKLDTLAQVINQIQSLQEASYSLKPLDIIFSYITNADVLEEKEAYNLSLQREERSK